MDDYFSKLTGLFEDLREAGVVIEDGELSLIALNGLNEAYDSFVTSQTARIDEICFASLLGSLHTFDNRISRHCSTTLPTANAVQSKVSVSLVCQICDEKGHSALGCYNRQNEQRFPSSNDRAKFRGSFNKNSSSFTESKGSSASANGIWYPDSGVSDHVTSDPQCIQKSHYNASPAKSILWRMVIKFLLITQVLQILFLTISLFILRIFFMPHLSPRTCFLSPNSARIIMFSYDLMQ